MKLFLPIFLIAFLVRLIPFSYVAYNNPEGLILFDSEGYLNLAENINTHQIFSRANSTQQLTPDISRTPIFPLFLSGIKIFSNSNIVICFILVLIGSINAILTFKLCLLAFNNQKIARLAALLVAIDIPSIYFSSVIMTETLFSTLLVLGIFLFMKREITTWNYLLSGFIFSLAILCRPIAIFLPLLLLTIMLARTETLKKIAIFLFATYFLAGLWSYRNYKTFDTFQLSSIGAINLYFHTSASINAEIKNITTHEAQANLKTQLQQARNWTGENYEIKHMIAYCYQNSLETIKNHPLLFLKQSFIGAVYFFAKPIRNYLDLYFGVAKKSYSDIGEKKIQANVWYKFISQTSSLTIILVFIQIVFNLIILLGLIYYLIKNLNNTSIQLFLGVIFYFVVTSMITEVDGRFRVPVMPFIAILGSLGLYSFMCKRSS